MECLCIALWFQLTELMGLHKSKMGDDEHWRAFSYSKCMSISFLPFITGLNYLTLAIRALRNYPRRIKNYAEARSIRGVGEKTARKVAKVPG